MCRYGGRREGCKCEQREEARRTGVEREGREWSNWSVLAMELVQTHEPRVGIG